MKKILVSLSAVVLMMVGMVGGASAIPMDPFQSTTELDRWVWGVGTTQWTMDMPDTFEMPPASVTSAYLTIYSNYVNGSNDVVSVSKKFTGSWVPLPGSLTPDNYSNELKQKWYLQFFSEDKSSLNPSNPLESKTFDVSTFITEPWKPAGAPLHVSLAYNEPIYKVLCASIDSPLFLDYAVLDLVWDNGSGINTAAPVPEPGTMALLGFGMLGLVIYGKRRMNRDA